MIQKRIFLDVERANLKQFPTGRNAMILRIKFLKLLVLLLICSRTVFAGLVWEEKILKFSPTGADSKVEAHFKFKNSDALPLTILKVRSEVDPGIRARG